MSAVPNSVNAVAFATVEPGVGTGGDNGVGFHSRQPVNIERFDDTENVHNNDKLKQSDGDLIANAQVANYPKWPQSPYVRYVSRPLSGGALSSSLQSFSPEDRSKMGTPLNPFWIRNDLWSMDNEADIFMDASPNWVAPRMGGHTSQGAQIDRETYLDNEQQIQHSTESSSMGRETAAAPVAPIAGQVTSAAAGATVNASDMSMENANPAKVNKDSEGKGPQEGDIDAKRKRSDEPSKGEDGEDKATPVSSSTASMTKKTKKSKKS